MFQFVGGAQGGNYEALGLSGDIIASSFGKAMHHGPNCTSEFKFKKTFSPKKVKSLIFFF